MKIINKEIILLLKEAARCFLRGVILYPRHLLLVIIAADKHKKPPAVVEVKNELQIKRKEGKEGTFPPGLN